MVKIAVMGDAESIKGFSSVGLDIFPVDENSAKNTFKKLSAGDFGIIYITEEFAGMLAEEIAEFDEKMLPAIIPIPGVKNNDGIGLKRLKASVEKAIGSDIIFNK